MDNAVTSSVGPQQQQKSRKKKLNPGDRVPVSVEARSRLDAWLKLISDSMKTQLTRGELVNFLVLSHAEKLTDKELSEIEKQFFDEVKFGQWAVEELKEALKRGEQTTLSEVIDKNRPKRLGQSRTSERHPRKKNDSLKSINAEENKPHFPSENSPISPRKSAGEVV